MSSPVNAAIIAKVVADRVIGGMPRVIPGVGIEARVCSKHVERYHTIGILLSPRSQCTASLTQEDLRQ